MAKGKQAALAANRRYEAAVEHIDRLTSELVDAKARARRYQRDAERVPALVAEIADLTRQVEAVETPRLVAERASAAEALLAAEGDRDKVVDLVASIITENRELPGFVIPSDKVHAVISRAFGTPVREAVHGFDYSREQRRSVSSDRSVKAVDTDTMQGNGRLYTRSGIKVRRSA